MTDFGEEYLKMTFEINKHFEGYIDSYFGPVQLKKEIESTRKRPIRELLHELENLYHLLPEEDKKRCKYLEKTLQAMEVTLKILKGERLPFMEEIEKIYDIKPVIMTENEIMEVRNSLDELLPKNQKFNLNERYLKWMEDFRIPEKQFMEAVNITMGEIRERTSEMFPLVEGESAEIEIVRNQPWKAYNYYLGDARSKIAICVDHPFYAFELPRLLNHEIYPGHHLFMQLRERLLYKDKGYLEATVCTLQSPMNVIAEGTANFAAEVIFKGESMYKWLWDTLLPTLELPQEDYETFYNILKTADLLHMPCISFNILTKTTIKYYKGEIDRKHAIEYYRDFGLVPVENAISMIDMMEMPLFRSYLTIYSEGYRLVKNYVSKGRPKERFKTLLTENILPSWL